MIVEIKKTGAKAKIQQAIELIGRKSQKKSLKKHFGKMKRAIDRLDYQRKVRDGWV